MQITGMQNQKQVTTKDTKDTKVIKARSKAGHRKGTKDTKVIKARSKAGHHEGHEEH